MTLAIEYRIDDAGGFAARIAGTNITSYAYPSSNYAADARRNPDAAARRMLAAELCFFAAWVETHGSESLTERAARHFPA